MFPVRLLVWMAFIILLVILVPFFELFAKSVGVVDITYTVGVTYMIAVPIEGIALHYLMNCMKIK